MHGLQIKNTNPGLSRMNSFEKGHEIWKIAKMSHRL